MAFQRVAARLPAGAQARAVAEMGHVHQGGAPAGRPESRRRNVPVLGADQLQHLANSCFQERSGSSLATGDALRLVAALLGGGARAAEEVGARAAAGPTEEHVHVDRVCEEEGHHAGDGQPLVHSAEGQ